MKLIQSKILCVAVLSLMAMTACQSAAVGDNTKVSTGDSATVAKETAADSDPKTVLVNSMKGLQDKKSWIAEVDTSNDAMPQGDVKMQMGFGSWIGAYFGYADGLEILIWAFALGALAVGSLIAALVA